MSDWVLQGSRPPSVTENRPRSAFGKTFGYHVVTASPSVDETLFRSFHKSRLDGETKFEAPWEKSKKLNGSKIIVVKNKKTRPLFWSPSPNSSCSNFEILKKGSGIRSEKFKLKKHNPTFCDETLFGKSDLSVPKFEAPWDCPIRDNIIFKDVNGNTVNINNNNMNGNTLNNNNDANWQKLKLHTRPKTAPGRRSVSEPRPLWRP